MTAILYNIVGSISNALVTGVTNATETSSKCLNLINDKLSSSYNRYPGLVVATGIIGVIMILSIIEDINRHIEASKLKEKYPARQFNIRHIYSDNAMNQFILLNPAQKLSIDYIDITCEVANRYLYQLEEIFKDCKPDVKIELSVINEKTIRKIMKAINKGVFVHIPDRIDVFKEVTSYSY